MDRRTPFPNRIAWLLIPGIVFLFHTIKSFTPPGKMEAPKDNALGNINVSGSRSRTNASRSAKNLFPTADAVAPNERFGSLAGRILFLNAGHGWVHGKETWDTGRGTSNGILEDYGNLDQMNLLVDYCLNAGATVVPLRPVGFQTNEIVLDNESPGVHFEGLWMNSTSKLYYGRNESLPDRFALVSDAETATATYVPDIPNAGFYPVYTWLRHGFDQTRQLYIINHSGGQSWVRVPHYAVGNGWVFLGTYFFETGSNAAIGSVVISNLRATNAPGNYVIADALRFGNGMGSFVPALTNRTSSSVSGYPREEECSLYWIRNGIGQGQLDSVFDGSGSDMENNVNAPPQMSRQMARETAGTMHNWLFLSLHSNTNDGQSRGTLALSNHKFRPEKAATENQRRLAEIIGREVNDHLSALTLSFLRTRWFDRGINIVLSREDLAYEEINNKSIGNEFDATILEIGFHDNAEDAALLREPVIRREAARAAYQGIVRYMHEFDRVPLVFLPEPPSGLVVRVEAREKVKLEWQPPAKGIHQPEGYRVYCSTNGYGFGQSVYVSGISNSSITFDGPIGKQPVYYRVTAVNSGGESLPSIVMGCSVAVNNTNSKVLFVNGFDRFDSGLNIRQSIFRHKGQTNETVETINRIKPRQMNSFDYVVQHGQALAASRVAFDSCDHSAVVSGRIRLTDYRAVIWALGRESTNDKTFDKNERSIVAGYLEKDGNLFVSGTDVAWDLGRSEGTTPEQTRFLESWLHATLVDDDADTFGFAGVAGGIFESIENGLFDDGTKGIYRTARPDVIASAGPGAKTVLQYAGGKGGCAGIQYDGSVGGGKVVFFGFPFETIISPKMRADCMARVLGFFGVRGEGNLLADGGRGTTPMF